MIKAIHRNTTTSSTELDACLGAAGALGGIGASDFAVAWSPDSIYADFV